ncbi:MAG: SPFH/Band 7/PHB domain protein [Ignavibacteriales bacterium]|nr:SPFH/Band 7/PHB domain protein [Ignavibacteriales bacterium]MCF8305731.1 SPFH/Band 7/PHB domain protein [Ignavibacteriales bacterium]MCF8315453.1 SPFH/Band 7/PHB domain protein [Ignavibacteriales bacterium]MCF8437019.1 SPFH/Band 7/PHB domain protein [Ignavibacteriales bacterium]
MEPGLIIIIFIALFVIIFVSSGFKIVQQAETIVIERLGRYNRTLESGINIIVPLFDKPRPIIWRYKTQDVSGKQYVRNVTNIKIDLREQVYDFPSQNVITKDNVSIRIDALLYFQIVDPVKAIYEIANLPDAIEKLTQTTLRNVIGELDLDECLVSRDTINSKLRAILDDASEKWGVKVNRVELQDITPPRDIQEAMEKQMRAERDRRAAILKAEGDKRSKILEAEGMKESEINVAQGIRQAAILKAEGEAEARIKVATAEAEGIRLIADAVRGEKGDPVNYVIAVRYIDTLKAMVSGKDNKVVYLPYEATSVLASLGGIKDLLKN